MKDVHRRHYDAFRPVTQMTLPRSVRAMTAESRFARYIDFKKSQGELNLNLTWFREDLWSLDPAWFASHFGSCVASESTLWLDPPVST